MKTLAQFFYTMVIIILTMGLQLNAQNQIGGTVTDNSGMPLDYVNVLLLDPSNDQLIKGTITTKDGTYSIDKLQSGTYTLAINMLGFEEFRYPPITVNGQSGKKEMGVHSLQEAVAQLDAVEVVAKKPLFQPEIDRLVINVANSITSAGSTALEVLERSPGVIVDRQNNGISLSGKDGVVVMINGRLSYMPTDALVQLLDGMSADNIEKIELLTTPPAKYDAEGNAGYINIVLKKNPDDGFNGSYSLSAGYGNGETGNANLNFNYRQGKINLFGSYGYSRGAREQLFSFDRSAMLDNELHRTSTYSVRQPLTQNHNARLGMDLQLSKKTIIGGLITSYDNKWTMDANNRATMSVNGLPQSFIDIQTDELNQWRHYGGNLNLQHTFKEGETLNADIDVLYYRDNNPTNYVNTYLDANEVIDFEERTRSGKITPIRIGVGKLDYARTLNTKTKLSAGLKGTISSFTNDVAVETLTGQNWLADADLTDKFELNEKILAAYTDLALTLDDKTSLKLGLRYEYTDSNLGTVENENIVDRQYGRFFPSVFLSRKFNESNAVNLSYSRRITRPTFNDMAPFVMFVDPTTFFSGNPALQPAFSNNFKIGYQLKSTLFSLEYSHQDSTIARFQSRVIPGTNDQLIFAENMKYQKTASFTISTPFSPARGWNMFVNASGVWQKVGVFNEGFLNEVELKSINVFSSQTFTLPKDFTLEVSGFYNSGSLFGSFVMKPFGAVNLGLQKKFKGGSSTLRLGMDNILNTMVWKLSSEVPELMQTFAGRVEFSRRTIKLTYSHNFGSKKVKAQRQRTGGSEDERNRVGN